jgi:biopolymer transport protein ExbD
MPLRSEPMEETTLNLTPMIDVVMLLIIFFLIGTKFSESEQEFDINLPTASSAQPLTSLPDELVVNITQEGEIFMNNELLSPEQLTENLLEARKNYDDQAVLIRGDSLGLYQPVMTAMSACHAAQIKHMKLASKPLESQK